MAKSQKFSDKATDRTHRMTCPVCSETIQFVKFMKAVKGPKGDFRMRPQNVGVCKCNQAEIYG